MAGGGDAAGREELDGGWASQGRVPNPKWPRAAAG